MVLTDDAKNDAARNLQTYVDNNFTHGAVGSGTNTESETASSLGNELLRKARANISDSTISGGAGDTTVSLFVNSSELNGKTLSEFGFFDASSGGEMQSIDNFSGVDKNNQIELYLELKVNIEVA